MNAFAKQHDLFLVEDCCDALGATHDGDRVGTFGILGTLSFYPAHHIKMGEGGAVPCNNRWWLTVNASTSMPFLFQQAAGFDGARPPGIV